MKAKNHNMIWMNLRSALYYLYISSIVLGAIAMPIFSQASTNITTPLASVCSTIKGAIATIAVILFILGGTLYAVAHMLPAAGNIRGNLQGWSLGMIMGGVVGLILVLIAGPLIGIISGDVGGSVVGVSPTTC
ncbi:MAG: hypothetical protein KGH72_01830 [Candidatus Micrarchaeota archaeon]|nr:hypothetical protein [Candidatus Micrarchaeota archaeon]